MAQKNITPAINKQFAQLEKECERYIMARYNANMQATMLRLAQFGTDGQKEAARLVNDWIDSVQRGFAIRLLNLANGEGFDPDYSEFDNTDPQIIFDDLLLTAEPVKYSLSESGIYHEPGCQHYDKNGSLKIFSELAALDPLPTPCGTCNPLTLTNN